MTPGSTRTRKREQKFRRSMERTPHVSESWITSASLGRSAEVKETGMTSATLGRSDEVHTDQINRHSYYDRAELAHACAVKAVQGGFSHLSVAQIITPPRSMKDAQFARQIAVHLMVYGLGIEQRHVTRMQHRQRTAIHFALQAVERRLECDVFRAVYERMLAVSQRHFEETLEAA